MFLHTQKVKQFIFLFYKHKTIEDFNQFNIDYSLDYMLVNADSHCNNDKYIVNFLPKSKWLRLIPERREIYKYLPKDIKEIILEY